MVRQHSPSESRPSTVNHISPPDCSRHSEPMDPVLSRNLAYGIVALPEFLPRMHACQCQAVPHAFVSDLSELNVKSYDPVSPNGAFRLEEVAQMDVCWPVLCREVVVLLGLLGMDGNMCIQRRHQ